VTAVLPELDLDGPAAPPRANGELVFAEPWQGRAFGLVMTLSDRGVVPYARFRDALVARIGAWDADPPPGEQYSYYRCWLQALEQVLAEHGLLRTADLDARSSALAARPAGHDHARDDDPDHQHDHQ
jgi:nitrile hydratase accessory protein